jgi:hypothetical protein
VEHSARYASYLLRLRQVRSDDQATWLASVQNVASGAQRSFPSVEALVTFLLAEFGRSEPVRGTPGVPDPAECAPGDQPAAP